MAGIINAPGLPLAGGVLTGTLQAPTVSLGGTLITGALLSIPVAVTGSPNYGEISIGAGPFDGTTSGFFTGNTNGTHIAINAGAGYLGRMLDAQIAGVRMFGVGRGSQASGASATLNAIDVPAFTVTITGNTGIATAGGFNYTRVGAPVYSAASALTITNAATLAIEGAPSGSGAGPATLTNTYALWIQAGTTRHDGHVVFTDNTYDIGASGATRPRTIYVGTSVFVPIGTVNTPGLQVGHATTGIYSRSTGVTLNIAVGGAALAEFGQGVLNLATNSLAWAATISSAADLLLSRDAANTLALRNGTNAQILTIYNTYTNSSNYERFTIGYAANIAYFSVGGIGTGSNRTLKMQADVIQFESGGGVARWQINGNGHLLASTDATYDIGASGATRPRDLFLSRNQVLGGTVTLAVNTSSTAGVILVSTDRFLHSYAPAGADGNNTFLGIQAGNFTLGPGGGGTYLGGYNTGVGYQALTGLTTGYASTAVGWQSLKSVTTGDDNTSVGYYSAKSVTTGIQNTAVGANSLWTATTSSGSVALGFQAGYYETGSNKLFIDNQQRSNEADARVKALIYGTFDATVANQRFIMNAVPGFGGPNSTGGGSALLGANSPASTLTAPYTWITVLTSDGSTGYIPVWK